MSTQAPPRKTLPPLEPQPPSEPDGATEELTAKLRWLMFFRVVMLTVLLGTALALHYWSGETTADPEQLDLVGLIVVVYIITILSGVSLNMFSNKRVFAYVQLVVDLGTAAVIVSLTGGLDSLFLFLFSLPVLNASILLFRPGALNVALGSATFIGLQVLREALNLGMVYPTTRSLSSLAFAGFTNISAVFLIALLGGYLSEQLQDAGQRLRSASEDLQTIRALNEHIVTSIQSGLISFTLDHKIIFFNPEASRIMDLSEAEALGVDVRTLFEHLVTPSEVTAPPDPDEHRWEERYQRAGELRMDEVRVLGCRLSPLRDGRGVQQGWLLLFRDLTPIRRMQMRVQRSERLATIGRLGAGIAHEIRNPLAAMSGSIQLLGGSPRLNAMDRRLIDIVQRETTRLDGLVNEFLEYARPAPPNREPLRIMALLRDLVAVAENRATEAPLKVVFSGADEAKVFADPEQIRQVFWNLINNAIDASEAGAHLHLSVVSSADQVRVRVRDQGCGISEATLSKIFEPFFTTKSTGTGLGLALSQRIVEEHQGELTASSEVGTGSVFTVTLPLPPTTPLSMAPAPMAAPPRSTV